MNGNLALVKAFMVIFSLGSHGNAMEKVPYGSLKACEAARPAVEKLGSQAWTYMYTVCTETKFGDDQ